LVNLDSEVAGVTIKIKSTLSQKDKKQIFSILGELSDYYSDFYITRNNIRLYIKENIEILYKLLNQGDKIIFNENGIAVVIGYSEKSSRKYLKLLTKSNIVADKLLKNLDWNISDDVFIKIKKNNPLKQVLLRNKYKFIGDRGREILLMKKGVRYAKSSPNQSQSTD